MKTMKVHETAKLFPNLPQNEMKELRADIEEHGIRVPILVNKKRDTILDGRHRYMVAYELDLPESDVPLEVFEGTDEEIPAEIVSRNIRRRHLTDEQRITFLAKFRGPQLSKEAAARQKAGGADLISKSAEGDTRDQLASEAKTSRYKAQQALDVARHAKEIVDDVIAGRVALREAAKVAKSRKPKSKAVHPRKKLTLQEEVASRWLKFINVWPHEKHGAVRDYVRELL